MDGEILLDEMFRETLIRDRARACLYFFPDRASKDWQGRKHCSPLSGGRPGQEFPARPYESFCSGGEMIKYPRPAPFFRVVWRSNTVG